MLIFIKLVLSKGVSNSDIETVAKWSYSFKYMIGGFNIRGMTQICHTPSQIYRYLIQNL